MSHRRLLALTLSARLVSGRGRSRDSHGQVAQLVEQGTENPRVGGSIPSLATSLVLAMMMLSACGDRCEALCSTVSDAIEECMESDPAWNSVSWTDLGARGRTEWARQCRRDWGRTSGPLANHELEEALDLCGQSLEDVRIMPCDELLRLYAPL